MLEFLKGNKEKKEAKEQSKKDAEIRDKIIETISTIDPDCNSRYSLYTTLRDFKEGRHWSYEAFKAVDSFSFENRDYGNSLYCHARPEGMEMITFNRCGPVVDKFVEFLGIQKMEFHVPKPTKMEFEEQLNTQEEADNESLDEQSIKADTIEKIGKFILFEDNDWKSISKVLAIDGGTYGDMFFESVWNPVTNKIRIRRIDPFSIKVVFKDSSFLDLKMTVEKYYLNIDDVKKEPKDGGLNKDGLLNNLSPDEASKYNLKNMVSIQNIWIDEGTEEKPKSRNIVIVGDKNIMVKNEVIEHPFPVYHVPTIRLAGRKYGESFIRQGIPLQKKINERMSDEAEIIKQYAFPWIIDDNSGQDAKDIVGATTGPKIIPVNEGGSLKFLEWSGRVYPVAEHIKMLIDSFDDVVSMPKIAYGNIEASIATGVSLTVSFQGTQNKISDWAENITRAVGRMWKNNLKIIEKIDKTARDIIQGHYNVKVEWGDMAPRDESLNITNVLNMKQANIISDMTAREKLGVPSPIDEQKQIEKEKNDPKYNPELALQKMQAMAQIEQMNAQKSEATGQAQAGSNEVQQRPTLRPEQNTVPQPRQATGVGRGQNTNPVEAPPI